VTVDSAIRYRREKRIANRESQITNPQITNPKTDPSRRTARSADGTPPLASATAPLMWAVDWPHAVVAASRRTSKNPRAAAVARSDAVSPPKDAWTEGPGPGRATTADSRRSALEYTSEGPFVNWPQTKVYRWRQTRVENRYARRRHVGSRMAHASASRIRIRSSSLIGTYSGTLGRAT
jgi:hypothetical protein